MDKIESLDSLTEDEREVVFKERATEYLSKLHLAPFDPSGLSLARSERELERCRIKIERAKHKEELKSRDRKQKSQEFSASKKITRKKVVSRKVDPKSNKKSQKMKPKRDQMP